jgi:erythromycin esterase
MRQATRASYQSERRFFSAYGLTLSNPAHMRSSVSSSFIVLAISSISLALACHSAPPTPVAPPPPLSDSATAAVSWVQAHAQEFSIADSVPSSSERARLLALVGDARIIGVSELTEGTRELPNVIRHMLLSLGDSAGVRGLAIQGPMAEALEVDRFVRTGVGDPRRLLRAMGSWRWENQETLALVNDLRDWNRTRSTDKQIGFYGFEIPTAAHAVQVVTSLPDSIVGATLKAWLTREYGCVAMSEGAHWGLEGRTSDSTFWNRCGVVATAGVDSIVALRARLGARGASEVAYAEQMARLIQHHVTLSLRHTNRHESNAEHLLFIANSLGRNAKLLAWGGDVEMGRLTLDKTTVQTGVPLGQRLGAQYRPIGFVFGDGVVRTRRASSGRGGAPAGLADVKVAPPLPNTYEDVLIRVPLAAYWVDARALPSDIGGAWLRGPRSARLVIELYLPEAPDLTETPVELPAFFDALVYVRHVTAARQ